MSTLSDQDTQDMIEMLQTMLRDIRQGNEAFRLEVSSRLDSMISRMDSMCSARQLVDRHRSRSSRMPSPVFSPIRDIPRELSNTYHGLMSPISETPSVSVSVSTSVETSSVDYSGCSGHTSSPYEEGEFEDICIMMSECLDEEENIRNCEQSPTSESSPFDTDATSDFSDSESPIASDNRYDYVSDSDLILSIPSYDEEGVEYYLSPSDSEEQDIKSYHSVSTTSSDQFYQYYFSDDDENASFDDDCPEPQS